MPARRWFIAAALQLVVGIAVLLVLYLVLVRYHVWGLGEPTDIGLSGLPIAFVGLGLVTSGLVHLGMWFARRNPRSR